MIGRTSRVLPLTERVKLDDASGCWLWQGTKISDGYGHIRWHGKMVLAHRLFAHMFLGFPLDERQVLHKCDVPACVNPAHLFIGDHRMNMRDCSIKKRTLGQKKTHCKRGHLLAGENIIAYRLPWRACRLCLRKTQREFARAKRLKSKGELPSISP